MPTQLRWPALHTGMLCCTEDAAAGPTDCRLPAQTCRACAGSPLRGPPPVPAPLPAAPVHRCAQPPARGSGGWRPPGGNARQQTPAQHNTPATAEAARRPWCGAVYQGAGHLRPGTLRACAAYNEGTAHSAKQVQSMCTCQGVPSRQLHGTHVCARHMRCLTPAQQLQQPRVRPPTQPRLMQPCLLHPALLLSRVLPPAQRPSAVPAAAAPALLRWPVLRRPAQPRLVSAA